MLIISTRAVAEIIQAVSAASIFGGAVPAGACASAGAADIATAAAANPMRTPRARASFVMLTPLERDS